METIAENRRARFDYEITDKFEAGIELLGLEVKSAKAGRLNLTGSYGIIRGGSPRRSLPPSPKSLRRPSRRSAGEAWLINAQIPPYQPNNTPTGYDQGRSRRLLLRRDEIKKLVGALKAKQFLIPLRAYVKNNFIKIELGLGRSRRKGDKRELLKKRSAEREMRQLK
jgi:SsrA-binding protein